MRHQSSRNEQPLVVEYTEKPLSGWGGLLAISRFFEAIGLRALLGKALPDGRTSNNQVPVVDMIQQFFVTVLTGGNRFQHVDRVAYDEAVRRIMQVKRFASGATLTRYLRNFAESQVQHMHEVLSAITFTELLSKVKSDILDLDSTVIMRWGKQEGSGKGYNPYRRGGRSHHPLLAMLAETKVIAHAWLRDGSANPVRGCVEFMKELLARLPKDLHIRALRADSGFYCRKLMDLLEDRNLPYVIVVKQHRSFTKWCAARTDWRPIGRDREISEGIYVSPKAKDRPRRMIVIRTLETTEKDLFIMKGYSYTALATTMSGTAEEIWEFYKGRGDCENRIKELKNDYHIGDFCLDRFSGTEAAFLLICFLHNLISWFKRAILHDHKPTLSTLRSSMFVVGAALGSSGRKQILRLGLRGKGKKHFEDLLETIQGWVSTAAQLTEALLDAPFEHPSPWRHRRSRMLRLS